MAGDRDRIALVHALADLAGRQISDIEVAFVIEHAETLPETGNDTYSIDPNLVRRLASERTLRRTDL